MATARDTLPLVRAVVSWMPPGRGSSSLRSAEGTRTHEEHDGRQNQTGEKYPCPASGPPSPAGCGTAIREGEHCWTALFEAAPVHERRAVDERLELLRTPHGEVSAKTDRRSQSAVVASMRTEPQFRRHGTVHHTVNLLRDSQSSLSLARVNPARHGSRTLVLLRCTVILLPTARGHFAGPSFCYRAWTPTTPT